MAGPNNGVVNGAGRGGTPPPSAGAVPHRVEIQHRDEKARPDPVALIRDVFEAAHQRFPTLVPPPNFRAGSWLSRLPLVSRIPGLKPADRALFAPWARYLHQVEVRLDAAHTDDRRRVEEFLLKRLMEITGATASLAHSGMTRADQVDVFSPQDFKVSDLIKGGIRVTKKGEESGYRIDAVGADKLGALFEAEEAGLIKMSGNFKALIAHYQTPEAERAGKGPIGITIKTPGAPNWPAGGWQWLSLDQIVSDIHRIQLHEIDVNDPQRRGYEPDVTLLNGVTVSGEAALHAIRNYEAEGLVNEHFRQQAELVHAAAEAAGGRLVFADGEQGTKRNRYLVGTGLTGEIANGVVESFFEGAGYVYMPGSTVESSKLAAALMLKNLAVAKGEKEKPEWGKEGYEPIHVWGGRLMVGATDGLDPGRVVASIEAVIPERHRALYAAMMYSPEGRGRELLLEIAQHAVAGRLNRDGKIDGMVRLRSPTMVGRQRSLGGPHRNDAAYFQGLAYQVAQLLKRWSDGILTRWEFLPVSSPTGFITDTEGLGNPIVDQVLPWAEDFDVAVARNPRSTGSFLAQSFIADLIVADEGDRPMNGRRAGRAVFDGGVSVLPRPLNTQLALALGRSRFPGEPKVKPQGHKISNVRVNGPVIEMLERHRGKFRDISEISDQVLAHSKSPKEGFSPFTFELEDGTTNYVMWIKDPSEFPGVIGERLKQVWHDSLGIILVVNPERDIVIMAHHHGLKETPWSPYRGITDEEYVMARMAEMSVGGGDGQGDSPRLSTVPLPGDGTLPRHALGGIMAYPNVVAERTDLGPLLHEFGLIDSDELPADFDLESLKLTVDQRAAVMFLGTSIRVANKAVAMTLKYALISQAFEAVGARPAGLGGAKSIILTPPDDSSRHFALRVLAWIAKKTGAYISGPDENVGIVTPKKVKIKGAMQIVGEPTERDVWPVVDGVEIRNWPDVVAEVAPYHMAGSPVSDPLVRGLGKETSLATARGGYEGLRVYLDESRKFPDDGIMFVGYGQAGTPLVNLALEQKRNVVAICDIRYETLAKVFADYKEKYGIKDPDNPLPFLLVWDSKAAKENLSPGKYQEQWERFHNEFGTAFPFIEAEGGLPDAIRKVNGHLLRKGKKGVGVLSPNGGPHAVTPEVVDALAEVGGHAIIGIANNMLALDAKGSYEAVARLAVEKGIFIPHDSAINMMGAASVVFKAVGIIRGDGTLDEEKMAGLIRIVGERVAEEFKDAHEKGIPPQLWRDVQAMIWWNAEVDAGRAVGGKFEIPDLSGYEPTPPTGGGGDGTGGDRGVAEPVLPAAAPAATPTPSSRPRAESDSRDPVSGAASRAGPLKIGTISMTGSPPQRVTRGRDDNREGMTEKSQRLLKLLLSAPREIFLKWIAKRGYAQEVEALRQAKAPLSASDRIDLIRAIASRDKTRMAHCVTALLAKTPGGAAVGARLLPFNPAFTGVPAAASVPARAVIMH